MDALSIPRRRVPVGTALHSGQKALRSPRPGLGRLAAAVVLLSAVGAALAQSSSASYQIPRQSIDGGAQRATVASYTVEATVGQPDAAPAMTSASYALDGGFFRPVADAAPDFVFADGFEAP